MNDRIKILRDTLIPRLNRELFQIRPDLDGVSEWRLSDEGYAYIHDFTAEEKEQRKRERLF